MKPEDHAKNLQAFVLGLECLSNQQRLQLLLQAEQSNLELQNKKTKTKHSCKNEN